MRLDGIRLICATQGKEGSVDVVWKPLSIHADEFNPLTTEIVDRRRALAKQFGGTLPTNALEFDGRTQYVTVPSIKYDGSHPITLETYVTHDRLNGCVVEDTQRSGMALGVPGRQYNTHVWNGKKLQRRHVD